MRRTAVLLVGMLLGGTAASADPVRVTSGFYKLDSGRAGEWVLQADALRLEGEGIAQEIAFWQCLECAPGTPLSLSARLNLDQPYHFVASAEIGGVKYPQVYWQGEFVFASGTVPAQHGGTATLPFTYTGSLRGFLTPHFGGTPFFAANLVGQGNASVRFFPVGHSPGGVEVASVFYQFVDPAPVPEPGTMLLLGSGLAGVLAARRREARRKIT